MSPSVPAAEKQPTAWDCYQHTLLWDVLCRWWAELVNWGSSLLRILFLAIWVSFRCFFPVCLDWGYECVWPMEATCFSEPSMPQMFFLILPQICPHLLSYSLLAVRPFIKMRVTFQIILIQLNLPQVNVYKQRKVWPAQNWNCLRYGCEQSCDGIISVFISILQKKTYLT